MSIGSAPPLNSPVVQAVLTWIALSLLNLSFRIRFDCKVLLAVPLCLSCTLLISHGDACLQQAMTHKGAVMFGDKVPVLHVVQASVYALYC